MSKTVVKKKEAEAAANTISMDAAMAALSSKLNTRTTNRRDYFSFAHEQ